MRGRWVGCCGREATALASHALLHGFCGRGVGCGGGFPLLRSFPLVRRVFSWDRSGRRKKGSLQRAAFERTADGKRKGVYIAMISMGRVRSTTKQKSIGWEHALQFSCAVVRSPAVDSSHSLPASVVPGLDRSQSSTTLESAIHPCMGVWFRGITSHSHCL